MARAYDELLALRREAATLANIAELLGWDQETMMPPRGAEFRAEEKALLSRLSHERATDPRLGELLDRAAADPMLAGDEATAANLREMRRDYERARKLPGSLVEEISRTASLALEAWKAARRDDDFPSFLPWLSKQIQLNRRKAECWGAGEGGELYDALLDHYEPGLTSEMVGGVFTPLRAALTPLIAEIASSSRRPSSEASLAIVPQAAQQEFSHLVLGRVGFDLAAGRLDTSTHPFSCGVGPGDTRITTRYRDDGFLDSVGSTLHEAGHGLYEQGLPKDRLHGQPLSEPVGLGVHESQSRLWENHVGRSREFWIWALPQAKQVLGSAFSRFSVDDVFGAINRVRPSLIRVEADEATYNLHVMLRFDLERAMIRGDLKPADLPGAWSARVRSDLGLDVPDDRSGCLQDIHWSIGAIGYFPTYTLGSLFAAQLFEAASRELGDLAGEITRGEFGGLLGWLRSAVHAHGRRYSAGDLCRRVTGRPLDHAALIRHLRRKLGPLHGVRSDIATAG